MIRIYCIIFFSVTKSSRGECGVQQTIGTRGGFVMGRELRTGKEEGEGNWLGRK